MDMKGRLTMTLLTGREQKSNEESHFLRFWIFFAIKRLPLVYVMILEYFKLIKCRFFCFHFVKFDERKTFPVSLFLSFARSLARITRESGGEYARKQHWISSPFTRSKYSNHLNRQREKKAKTMSTNENKSISLLWRQLILSIHSFLHSSQLVV